MKSVFELGSHVVVLMNGEIDIVPSTNLALLAAEIETIVSVIHRRYNLAKITICKLFPSFKVNFGYNDRADKVNAILRDALPSLGYFVFENTRIILFFHVKGHTIKPGLKIGMASLFAPNLAWPYILAWPQVWLLPHFWPQIQNFFISYFL